MMMILASILSEQEAFSGLVQFKRRVISLHTQQNRETHVEECP